MNVFKVLEEIIWDDSIKTQKTNKTRPETLFFLIADSVAGVS